MNQRRFLSFFAAMAARISVLLLKTPRADEEKHLERMDVRRLSEDDVPHLGSASLQTITWSIVSGFKGLENDVVMLAALTDIETDWHRGVAYVGMSRARTRLHVIIHEDCDGKRRERELEWEARAAFPCCSLDLEHLRKPLLRCRYCLTRCRYSVYSRHVLGFEGGSCSAERVSTI